MAGISILLDLCTVVAALEQLKCALSEQLRTSQLWLSYIEYVDIMKLFLIAECTSDWILHLHACQAMLNHFAASGHNNYAKSCGLYVQQGSTYLDNSSLLAMIGHSYQMVLWYLIFVVT